MKRSSSPVIPAQAGIQFSPFNKNWIPDHRRDGGVRDDAIFNKNWIPDHRRDGGVRDDAIFNKIGSRTIAAMAASGPTP